MFSSCCRCVNKKALKEDLSENGDVDDDEQVSPASNAEKTAKNDGGEKEESKAQSKRDNKLLHCTDEPLDTTLMVIIEENDAKEDDTIEKENEEPLPPPPPPAVSNNEYVEVIHHALGEKPSSGSLESENESVKSLNGLRKVNDMTDEEKQQLLDQEGGVKYSEYGKIFFFISFMYKYSILIFH